MSLPTPTPEPSGPLFPAFLKLTGRKVVLVGGGLVAVGKCGGLQAAGALVTVVAPRIRPELRTIGSQLVERAFVPSDLDDAWFVVAAAPPEINRAVAAAAMERRLFVNAVDDQQSASAYAGGVLRRGDITVAFSTGGAAPALAGLLREGLDAVLPPEIESWLKVAADLRPGWQRDGVPMSERRPRLLEALSRLYADRPRSPSVPPEGRP